MVCGIYRITNVISGKVYVGSSRNTTKRKYEHFYKLKKGIHHNSHLQSAYDKYGKESFHFMVVEICSDGLLTEREDYWIGHYDSRNPEKGYNLLSADRREVSEETKAKIASANKGNLYNLGKTHTKETKDKISATLSGRVAGPHSEETRRRISEALTGRSLSDEHKLKVSLARRGTKPPPRKGVPHSEETKAKMSASHKARFVELKRRD